MTDLFKQQKKLFLYALWLIGTASKWTRNTNARDDMGARVSVADPNACRFCSFGALEKAKYDLKPYCVGAGLLTSMGYYFSDTYETTIEAFNDNNDYNTVIDAWIDFGKSEKFIDEHFTMNQLERLVNFVA